MVNGSQPPLPAVQISTSRGKRWEAPRQQTSRKETEMSKHEGASVGWTAGRKTARAVQIALGLIIAIILASVVKRLLIDMPHIAAGTVPADSFDRRYVTQPWLA